MYIYHNFHRLARTEACTWQSAVGKITAVRLSFRGNERRLNVGIALLIQATPPPPRNGTACMRVNGVEFHTYALLSSVLDDVSDLCFVMACRYLFVGSWVTTAPSGRCVEEDRKKKHVGTRTQAQIRILVIMVARKITFQDSPFPRHICFV